MSSNKLNKSIEISTVTENDYDESLRLINYVFRDLVDEEPLMAVQFPLTIGRENMNRMIIGKVDGKIVTSASYIVLDIEVEDKVFKTGFIGSVCTYPGYEGMGYSSLVLKYMEDKMIEEGVEIVSVSGTRSLYRRMGFIKALSFNKYRIFKSNGYKYRLEDYDIEKYEDVSDIDDTTINEMFEIFDMQSPKIITTPEKFKLILNASTMDWGKLSFNTYVFRDKADKSMIGYAVIKNTENIPSENKNNLKLDETEPSGYGSYSEAMDISIVKNKGIDESRLIEDFLRFTLEDSSTDYINLYIHVNYKKRHIEGFDEMEVVSQAGTIRSLCLDSLKFKLKDSDSPRLKAIYERICNMERSEDTDRSIFEGYEANPPMSFIWTEGIFYQ